MAAPSILVVDDNPANVKLAFFVLNARGFDVRTASNAEEAMAEITTRPPTLVLMDLQMPGTDGLTLTRLLKADPSTRGLIIIAFTAYAMEGDVRRRSTPVVMATSPSPSTRASSPTRWPAFCERRAEQPSLYGARSCSS